MTGQLGILESEIAGRLFRPIHYLGNKWRALSALETAVDELSPPPGAALDLFSGSGVVAARLGQKRPVIAADIQEYGRVLASALLMPAHLSDSKQHALLNQVAKASATRTGEFASLLEYEIAAFEQALASKGDRLAEILEQGSMMASGDSEIADGALRELLMSALEGMPKGADTVLTRYYGGIYFSYKQAADLDAIASVVRCLPPKVRDTALAALLSTASQIVSTVGNQFAQPIRPRSRDGRVKHESVGAVARTRQLDAVEAFRRWLTQYQDLPPSAHSHQVMRGDYRDVLDQTTATVSIIYADPPYTRDHYSRFYHVLETIAVGDEPDLSRVTIGSEARTSRGLYRAERHQSPFCIKTEVRQAFRDLVQGAAKHGVPLLISYSPYSNGSAARPQTRLMTIPDLESIVNEHFDHVEVRSMGRIAHSKLNAERLNIEVNPEAEVVIIGRF
ncbi:MAG: hypothetical protein GEU68_09585 [Actinobacteria bacterium]|nr:hypothetical protein [Actinomycetota bacterium]